MMQRVLPMYEEKAYAISNESAVAYKRRLTHLKIYISCFGWETKLAIHTE